MRHLTVFALVFFLAAPASALEVPVLRGRVTDLAGLLAKGDSSRIAAKLKQHESATGQQFALLVIPSLEGDPLEDFSMRVVEAWKLGKAKEDTGLLMLIVKGDRKMRIEVGYGLEGDIPDALAAQVIRNVLTPAFRSQKFAAGINDAFDLLIRAGGGQAVQVASAPSSGSGSNSRPMTWFEIILFLGFFIGPMLFNLLTGRRGGGFFISSGFGGGRSSGGGGFSGGGGSFGGGGASGSW
jgi:uncharacterized protein